MFEMVGGDRHRYRHYDSSRGNNRHAAEVTAAQFAQMLGQTGEGPAQSRRAPAATRGLSCRGNGLAGLP